MNPAVTLALAVAKDFPWKRLPVYWLAQYFGALVASGSVLGVYYGSSGTCTKFHHIMDLLTANDVLCFLRRSHSPWKTRWKVSN